MRCLLKSLVRSSFFVKNLSFTCHSDSVYLLINEVKTDVLYASENQFINRKGF
jgi:hypothetical protein